MAHKEVISPERQAARKIEMAKRHIHDHSQVAEILKTKKYIPVDLVEKEVTYLYNELSFHDFYFRTTPAEIIAQHVAAIYAAKIVYATTGKLELSIDCDVSEDYAMRAVATVPGGENPPCYKIETELESRYIANNFCTSSYVTAGTLIEGKPIHCRLYLLTRAKWAKKDAGSKETELKDIADGRFLERATENTKKIYSELMVEAIDKLTPVIKTYDFTDSNERRIVVAWRQHAGPNYFSEISHLFSPNGVYSSRKYCEAFANGMRFASFYLAPIDPSKPITLEQWESLVNDISAAYVLPSRVLGGIGQLDLSRNQEAFMYAAWKFAHQFLNRYDEDYRQISGYLGNIPGTQPKILLSNLKRRLRHDTFSESAVLNSVIANVELIKEIYDMFSKRFNPTKTHPIGAEWEKMSKDMDVKICKVCGSEFDVQVVKAVNNLVHYTLKTNFYRNEKAAIAFRLDGKFLPTADYPVTPYGVFFIIGNEFRGFHVRFSDIARGGIRVIKSPNRQAFTNNVSSVFDENYNLAFTQQKKNKDIPEGGSKGTILLNMENQESGEICFEKYVCSLMDVLVPECIQVDYTGRTTPEILFLGPDEYTAELMAWAVDYTKTRKYQVWKAVTTGKPPAYGGVPHDTYGMTTRSVHQFVIGTLEKLGIKEESVKKFQTGGPDGDLGSNEVLISKDTTIAVVDGSGVLHDPAGINHEELSRLAHKRVMVREFNKAKLGPKGYFVDVNDKNITLPDGTVVESGMAFRNNYHLHPACSCELFVPCGGRPESVNASNFSQILDANGKCKWKYVIEGANLFFTQPARLEAEKLGVILFKDASANKGGVTSSSKEVTAALALSDEEFVQHMVQRKDGSLPEFYQAYVQDIIRIIEKNARDEFECLWQAHEELQLPFCELTDKVSLKINSVADGIDASDLWKNKKIRDNVFLESLPPTLLKLIGLNKFYERVPLNYQQAIFSSHIASQFVYKCGYVASDSPFTLMAFLNKYDH